MTVLDVLLAVSLDVDPRPRDERLDAARRVPDETVLQRDPGELTAPEWERVFFHYSPNGGFAREDIQAEALRMIEARSAGQSAERLAPAQGRPSATSDAAREPLAKVLAAVETYIRRFVKFPDPDHQLAAISLWVAHTYAMDAAETTPYLAVTAPEKGSGKSRLLEVLECLVHEPRFTANVSVPALFRLIERDSPTLLLDEYDAQFRGNQDRAQELRGILNAGWRRGAKVYRVDPSKGKMAVESFGVFTPKALAGIGLNAMPDTVRDRSIIIRLQRQKQNDRAEKFRRHQAAQAEPIRSALATLMESLTDQLATALPDLPEKLPDRAADGWEPLIAIADLAGEEWLERARAAALVLSAGGDPETDSLRVRLLADIRDVFLEPRLFTRDLLQRLNNIEDAPWSDLQGGKELNAKRLADLLRDHSIRRKDIRIGDGHGKGYVLEDFADAFERYLPSVPTGDNGDNSDTA